MISVIYESFTNSNCPNLDSVHKIEGRDEYLHFAAHLTTGLGPKKLFLYIIGCVRTSRLSYNFLLRVLRPLRGKSISLESCRACPYYHALLCPLNRYNA